LPHAFGDKKDKAGGKGPTACGEITLPNEKDLFAAWPNLNKKCAENTKEGENLPRVGCKGQLIVSLGGNSVQVAVQDCEGLGRCFRLDTLGQPGYNLGL
jgi:hypothetical protein